MQKSIGKQLFLTLSMSITGLWLLVILSISAITYRETQEIFDNSLQETAQRILALAIHDLEKHGKQSKIELDEPPEHSEYVTYQLFDAHGKVLLGSHSAPAEPFPIPLEVGFTRLNHQVFYVESTSDGRYFLILAEGVFHREHTLAGLILSLAIPLGALLPLIYLVIFWALRRAEGPLRDFSQEVAARGGANLKPLELENVPTEISQLAVAINALLTRLQQMLQAERLFATNSAHELRTPVAIALAHLDLLKSAVHDEDALSLWTQARTAVLRIQHTSTKLLQLSRADAGIALNHRAVDLLGLIQLLIRDLQFTSAHAIKFEEPDSGVTVIGDVDAIGIVLINLLENANRYATTEGTIEVKLKANGCLSIENDCAPIPRILLPTLTQAFVRGSDVPGGSGLGLSIVQSIARQIDAELTIESPIPGTDRGFRVSIGFQVARLAA